MPAMPQSATQTNERGILMKNFIITYVITLLFALSMPIAEAGTKCEPDSRGGFCCWDVERDGIFKPISCA